MMKNRIATATLVVSMFVGGTGWAQTHTPAPIQISDPTAVTIAPLQATPLVIDYTEILNRIEQKLDTHVALQAETKSTWEKLGMFAVKYILPLVGGFLVGNMATK